MMLIRANALVKGYSGIRLETLETLINMINKGVHPYIPEKRFPWCIRRFGAVISYGITDAWPW